MLYIAETKRLTARWISEMTLEGCTMSKAIPLSYGIDPKTRGYHAVYRENEVNHCPGCGRTHWFLGRVLAECAFCATALPLADTAGRGQVASFTVTRKQRQVQFAHAA
jgi:hypothetical protein